MSRPHHDSSQVGDRGPIPGHPLLRDLRLDPFEPVVFWRDRWKWPWWDAATFGAKTDLLVGKLETLIAEVGSAGAASREVQLAFVERAHPLTWAVEAAAQVLGRSLLLQSGRVSPVSSPEEAGDQEIGPASSPSNPPPSERGNVSIWRLDGFDDHFELHPTHWNMEVSSGGSSDLWVDRRWMPSTELAERARGLPEPRVAGGRPVVLMAEGNSRLANRLAMAWGAAHAGCWLFGDGAEGWVEDLVWARAHAGFGGAEELSALVAHLEARPRRARRDLHRLELLAFSPTCDAPDPAAQEHFSVDLEHLRDLVGQFGVAVVGL